MIDIHKIWKQKSLINYILSFFSLLWLLLAVLRRLKTKQYKSNLFVICVGNINLGGSGKTPTAINIGKMLLDSGYKVAYLTKGYKGIFTGPIFVNANYSYKEFGDEPIILSQYCPTMVSKNLAEGLKELEKGNFDVVILDDGMQNPTIFKDMNIVVVNGSYGFGNCMVFPAGPLRERLDKRLKTADSIIVLEEDKANIKNKIKTYNNNIYNGYYSVVNKENNSNKNVYAFCGIGMPEKFCNTLKDMGYNILKSRFYKDHYIYSNEEIDSLIKYAQENNLQLITTEKDFIKLSNEAKKVVKYIKIDLILLEQHNLLTQINIKYKQKYEKSK